MSKEMVTIHTKPRKKPYDIDVDLLSGCSEISGLVLLDPFMKAKR